MARCQKKAFLIAGTACHVPPFKIRFGGGLGAGLKVEQQAYRKDTECYVCWLQQASM
jgi:hypothetical protein